VKVHIYIEGGGDGKQLRTQCRRGFRLFFEKALSGKKMPTLIACGSRNDAYKDFCTALKNAKKDTLPLLLVDSEAPFSGTNNQWAHLKKRDNWQQPTGATDEHVYLMVECMESWFLADRDCLKKYFGQGFSENALSGNENIETIPKAAIFRSLKNATRLSETKGAYGKGKHPFEILAKIAPNKVTAAAPNAKRLIKFLNNPS